jgi:hypothetical protein
MPQTGNAADFPPKNNVSRSAAVKQGVADRQTGEIAGKVDGGSFGKEATVEQLPDLQGYRRRVDAAEPRGRRRSGVIAARSSGLRDARLADDLEHPIDQTEDHGQNDHGDHRAQAFGKFRAEREIALQQIGAQDQQRL